MRPLRSFLLLLIFLACFTGLHYLIHTNQLFPSIDEFVPSSLVSNLLPGSNNKDSILNKPTDTIKISLPDTIAASISSPVIPENKSDSPLQRFLDSLKYSRGQIRILYYGDSQIEGDRVTSYLRHTLRKERGGTGPGLFLPLMPVMYTKSLWIRSSSNWKRYNYLSYKTGEISHRNLGPFMAICRYLPEGETRSAPEKAFIRIKPSNVADSSSSEYDILRIFYGKTEGTVNVVVKADDNEVFADTLKRGPDFNEIKCPLNRERDIEIEFEGKVSPDIYGISIESETGVVVDNISQRGSAGLEFTMVDRDNLREAYKKLSPDLLILHYGLNIVKNARDDYSYYQKGLVRQIALIRKISPLTPVLIVGVTDMAANDGDSIKSYKNIPAIIDAQKRAALKAGVNFWDSYGAMGGKSSIIRWAGKKPPLAQKDFIHFTYTGADTLSDMLVSSLFVIREIDTARSASIDLLRAKVPIAPMIVIDEPKTGAGKESLIKSLVFSLLNFDPDKPFIFTSAAFWMFFLFVLAGYSLVYKKLVIRNVYLFLVSLFFYYKAGGLFLFILIFVTIVDYSCGFLIFKSKRSAGRKFFVLLSIISNLGLLGYFKYTSFIINTINEVFGTRFKVFDLLSTFSNSFLGTHFDISYIILPVGISFFTFQSLSYTIDVYRKKMEPVRNIIDFGFYVSFFPHLVAGPIVRASVFIPQIYQEFRLSKQEFSHALFMISKGLIKKIVISNFIALNLVDRVFDAPSIYSGFENLLAIYGYGLQIYCDFSGYTDIAIGVALILGFRLPVNFNSPYKAKSITDFWKRWHISLSQWLRDYLYISLGGNRKGKIRTYFNLMITMLLGGLWHGASLKFVIWGGLHGIGLVINKLWNSIFKSHLRPTWIGRLFAVFITFQFVSFCWIFFRAQDLENVKIMLKQIFENFSPGSYMTVLPAYSSALLLMFVGYIIHFLPEKTKESYRGLFIKIPLVAQLAVIMVIAILLYQMRTTEVMPFIYFRF
jgi:D-alanyl-lipoteichoic acid acyltransferase DltB (MBOAT superfamily)/lysophospholipase L1-like esterase